jgi:pimeloyl-ACP methyl ester carboxylesterase
VVGFSAGAGFTLRFAGSAMQDLFDHYVLLSPFLHQAASSARPSGGGWVGIGLPRIIALNILNRMGVSALNHLPVMAFATKPRQGIRLAEYYSYALAENFRPLQDYRANISAVNRPLAVLVGEQDELFYASRFQDEFAAAKQRIAVSVIAGCNHVGLVLQPAAIEASVAAVRRLMDK